MAAFPFFRLSAFLLMAASFCAPAWAADTAKPLEIVRITPSGEDVAAARQIVVEFNRPVAAPGPVEDAKALGIAMTPSTACAWRWLNASALSCDLTAKNALPQATNFTLTVEPLLKGQDGGMLEKPITHKFTTERPRLDNSSVQTWLSPGRPALRAVFTQPVTKSSVEGHIFFKSEKNGTRYAITATRDENDNVAPRVKNEQEARTIWILTPPEELSADEKITLEQESGLISAEGDALGIAAPVLRTIYAFPTFSFRGVYCFDKTSKEILIAPGMPQKEDALCNPMMPIGLSFTAPVLRSALKDNLGMTPPLGGMDKNANPWGDEDRNWSRLSDQRSEPVADYRIGLPIGLKAAQSYTLDVAEQKISLWQKILIFFGRSNPGETTLRDEFGRALPPLNLTFATGHRNPNYELTYRDAVLETGIDSDVPLYVNNLKKFNFDYTALTATGTIRKSTSNAPLPDVLDKQFAVPSGVRDMLGGKSGALYARLKTNPPVEKWDNANRLFAQVTPYQIYFKLGHFRSVAWVANLADGKPAANATVTLYAGTLEKLQSSPKILAKVKTDENGLAMLPGQDTLDPTLTLNRAWKDEDERLFVRVDGADGMALLPVGYEYSVQMWDIAEGIYADINELYGHMKSWGMTAQGIYRAGDTMQYKIYIRDQDNNRFIAPPNGTYGLEISDPAGKVVEKRNNLSPSIFGTLDGDYAIPETASVGWYSFKLTADFPASAKTGGKKITREFYPLSVLVSDFTPAPFRVTAELNGEKFRAGDTLDIAAAAKLHSGGAYGGASIRTSVTLRSRPFTPKDPLLAGYWFDTYKGSSDHETILEKTDTLNDSGEWKTTFTLPEKDIAYGKIDVESAVRDDRGKSIAAVASADYAGVDRLVGIQSTRWVYESGKKATLDIAVVDPDGKIVPDTDVYATIDHEVVSTAKVKSAGNAYLGDSTVEWKHFADCHLKSGSEGVPCVFTPKEAGTYRLTATVKDSKGREHKTQQTLYVSGADYVQWNEDKEYALSVLPEKPDYKVGDTARYLVKNPYPGATALVTVERYGVLDSFTMKLKGSAPIIEIPVKEDYAPGFYVSVVLLSPRVESPPPEIGQIDMGKPAFRAGYAKTLVPDPVKKITLTVKPEQDTYRPRETVDIMLHTSMLDGDEPVEIAVAVLDESVFDLIKAGRDAFDPYTGFYALDSIDVANYSLLTRLMGRQKFEKKGANPGGDGGVDAGMRNVFKYVSYWNSSVPIDKDGTAMISFEAPDNLTGWRVLALAVTPSDRMGLGEANFKVNRPTEIRPAMPNQVREGDAFGAAFTVMNRTDEHRAIKVTVTAEGDVKDKKPLRIETTVDLAPYKRATVSLPVDTAILPTGREKARGEIRFNVTAGDEMDSDGIEHKLPVLKSRTVQTIASYGAIDDKTLEEKVSVPAGIYADSTDFSLLFSPTLLTGLDGSFRYMRDYAYTCWEQKITTAVLANQYNKLKPYLAATTVWDDAQSLPDKILGNAAANQAPNGGMAYFNARDDYADPYLSAYTALAFGWLREDGHTPPPSVESALQNYLLGFLRNDIAPEYYTRAMTASVRAIILAALSDTGKITPDDILRFRPDIPAMDVFGLSHYVQASAAFGKTKAAHKEALDNLLARGVMSSGKFSLNDKSTTGFERILTTEIRSNCAALGTLVSDNRALPASKASSLVRFITQGRKRDHWENTQENAFCMNALLAYAKKYESAAPRMTVTAKLDDLTMGEASFTQRTDAPQTLIKPLGEPESGKEKTLYLEKTGSGRAYFSARLRYAPIDLSKPRNDGIDINREYSVMKDGKWTAVTDGTIKLRRGDLVRVDLYVSLPTARNFVVVNDPLPGALETINRDLATASQTDDDKSDQNAIEGSRFAGDAAWTDFAASRWGFYHRELRNDSARFYADWLEPGNYRLTYTAQAVAEGDFAAPPVRAEEMYDPDISGTGVMERFNVKAAP